MISSPSFPPSPPPPPPSLPPPPPSLLPLPSLPHPPLPRQAVVIGILKATGVLKQGVWQNYDVDDVAQGLQVRRAVPPGAMMRTWQYVLPADHLASDAVHAVFYVHEWYVCVAFISGTYLLRSWVARVCCVHQWYVFVAFISGTYLLRSWMSRVCCCVHEWHVCVTFMSGTYVLCTLMTPYMLLSRINTVYAMFINNTVHTR